jgi:glutamate transport system permease protein
VFDFLSDYNDPTLLGAFWMTVKLTFFSAIGSMVWGTLLAAMRVSPVPLMRGFGTAYVNIVRNIPLTVIIIFTSLGLADIFGVTKAAV